MADISLILLRWAQFATAAILMGSPLFFVYALPRDAAARGLIPGARALVTCGAFGLAFAAAVGLLAQTAVMAGSFGEAARPSSLAAVAGMDLGAAAIVRIAGGLAAGLVLAAIRTPGRGTWTTLGLIGVLAAASFAWSGHGASSEGYAFWIHLASDVLHCWAASAWIGALFVFGLLLRDRGQSADVLADTHRALARFSTKGTLLVALLLATGLANSWYLVGPERLPAMLATDYGLLLALKLLAFGGMLGLAATNRFRLAPQLASSLAGHSPPGLSLGALRRSVALETGLGLAILGLVAWLGTLAPPSAA